MRQKPSDRSIFANVMVSSRRTQYISVRSRGRTRRSSLTGQAGNCCKVVESTGGTNGGGATQLRRPRLLAGCVA